LKESPVSCLANGTNVTGIKIIPMTNDFFQQIKERGAVSKLISRIDDIEIKSDILGKVKSLLMLASSAATSTTTKD